MHRPGVPKLLSRHEGLPARSLRNGALANESCRHTRLATQALSVQVAIADVLSQVRPCNSIDCFMQEHTAFLTKGPDPDGRTSYHTYLGRVKSKRDRSRLRLAAGQPSGAAKTSALHPALKRREINTGTEQWKHVRKPNRARMATSVGKTGCLQPSEIIPRT